MKGTLSNSKPFSPLDDVDFDNLPRPTAKDLPPVKAKRITKPVARDLKGVLDEKKDDGHKMESSQSKGKDKGVDIHQGLADKRDENATLNQYYSSPLQDSVRDEGISRQREDTGTSLGGGNSQLDVSSNAQSKSSPQTSPAMRSPQDRSPAKTATRRSFDPHYEMAVGYSPLSDTTKKVSFNKASLEEASKTKSVPSESPPAKGVPDSQPKQLEEKAQSKAKPDSDSESDAGLESDSHYSGSDSSGSSSSSESGSANESPGESDKTPLKAAIKDRNQRKSRHNTDGSPRKKPRNTCLCCGVAKARFMHSHMQNKVADENSAPVGHNLKGCSRNPFKWLWQGLVISWKWSSCGERAAALSLSLVMFAELYPSIPKTNAALSAASMFMLGHFPWLKYNSTQSFYWSYTGLIFLTLISDIAWMARPDNMTVGLEDYADAKEDLIGNSPPPSVNSVFEFSAVMIGFNIFLKLFYWYSILNKSPFGKGVLRTLNKRAMLFLPICRETEHPVKETSNRLIALLWAHLVLGGLFLMVGGIVAFSFQWASQFTSDNFGVSLTVIALVKGLTCWFVAAVLLHKMEISAALELFGCLVVPGLRDWFENRQGKKKKQHGTDHRVQISFKYLRQVAAAKLFDWCIGVWMWAVLATESEETFTSGQVSVAGIMGAMVFLLVVTDIWIIFLALVVFTIFKNQLSHPVDSSEDESEDSSGVFESSSEEDSSEDSSDSSRSSKSESPSSRSSSSSYSSSSSSSEDDSSEDQRSRRKDRRRRRRKKKKAKAKTKQQKKKMAVERQQPTPLPNNKQPKGLDNLLLRPQPNRTDHSQPGTARQGVSYEFDFSRAFDHTQHTPRDMDIDLSESFLISPEEFNSFWDSPAFSQTKYSCNVQMVPTVETLSSHLQSRYFFVVASGKVAVYTKLYACAMGVGTESEDPIYFLMEMVFDRQNNKLNLIFKCKKPELTPRFVQYLSLKEVVGAYFPD